MKSSKSSSTSGSKRTAEEQDAQEHDLQQPQHLQTMQHQQIISSSPSPSPPPPPLVSVQPIRTVRPIQNPAAALVGGMRRNKKTRYSPRPYAPQQRPQSVLSCATSDSGGQQSQFSSSMWSSGGLFSQVEPTSSSITTATDFSSTISRRSLFCQEWPDEATAKMLSAPLQPPPYAIDEEQVDDDDETMLSTRDILDQLADAPADCHKIFQDAVTWARRSRYRPTEEEDDDMETRATIVYQAAAEWGSSTKDPCALVWQARCLVEGWGTLADPTTGFSTLKKLAHLGCWEAYYPLSVYYKAGLAPEEDDEPDVDAAALHWLETAAQLEDTSPPARLIAGIAQYRLGEMHFKGEGALAEDAELALQWFQTSAKNGNK